MSFGRNPKGFEYFKTYLAVSLWTQVLTRIKPNTLENTAVVRPVAGGASLQGTARFRNVQSMKLINSEERES